MKKPRSLSLSHHWQWVGAWFFIFGVTCRAGDLEQVRVEFTSGQYRECIAHAEKIVAAQPDDEEGQLLLSPALLMTGQYREALNALTNALTQDSRSLRLRWHAREVLESNGDKEGRDRLVDEIIQRGASRPWTYRDNPASLVILGRALLLRGLDPKRVLDTVFDNARKLNPKLKELYLASGQLALDNHDFALAARKFQDGLKESPDDPELEYGLARAYSGDQPSMLTTLNRVLELNSNHVASLLLLVDRHIDAEDYLEAAKLLDRINAINPWHPESWAYRAVLAHLHNDPQAEEKARETALKFWTNNPRVDHLIGQKLSQNYRFAEGASHQRQALQHDAEYLPAKAQLAQDLLRLGDEGEGWKLIAQEVQKQDGYDVQAFNLVALRDKMASFVTLTNDDFLVRMGSREAPVYGAQVLRLLGEARSNLCAKYGLELKRPTIVEVFPEQKDFAVRTFGMPGNPGYLGVCFGRVITANSPASHGSHPVNWQAVLWHEFCHVVTLQLTGNKMPRWLSEGISVYEEIQSNPSWGQHMNPQYREMVLGDELTPLSKLSGAFLSPRSDLHLQFAYFEASLVVEFLVQRFGLEQLKGILHDLGEGSEINKTLEKHTLPIEKLDDEFAAYARERAEKLAPGLDFEKPEFVQDKTETNRRLARPSLPTTKPKSNPDGQDSWASWAKERPTNFWALNFQAQELAEAKKWAEAKPILKRVLELYPDFSGPDSAYRLLAATHRALGETNSEVEVLARFAAKDHEAIDAYWRLMELSAAKQEWLEVIQNARRYLAVNPLVAAPYRFLAEASEKTGDAASAIAAYTSMLALDPPDPAHVHFHLAQLLHRKGDPAARRHVLQALEEAPRYRDALRLLLQISDQAPQSSIKGADIPLS